MTINYTDNDKLLYVYSPNHTGLKKRNMTLGDAKAKFLKRYMENFNISETLYEMHMSRNTFYNICEADPEFRNQVDIVKEGLIGRIEDKVQELCDRGNDKILTWYLQRLDPERFESRQTQISIDGADKIEFKLNLNTDE